MRHSTPIHSSSQTPGSTPPQILGEFSFPSQPGQERQAMEQVAAVFSDLGLSQERLERLKTAVAEAILNAMEHGNGFRPDLEAKVTVLLFARTLAIHITDLGGGKEIPLSQTPDLEAKLAGLQSPRGWGLFIIRNMVDEMHIVNDEIHHTVELVMYLNNDPGDETAV